MVYNLLFFSLQNAVCFIILMYLVPVLFTFYIHGVLKLKKNNSSAKRLIPEQHSDSMCEEHTLQCHLEGALAHHSLSETVTFWV